VRAMGEELLRLKAQLAGLQADIRVKDAALAAEMQAKEAVYKAEIAFFLQAKEAALQAKEAVHKAEVQAKEAALQAKEAVLQSKDAVIEAKEALIRRLQSELQRRDGGAAAAPAPAPASAHALFHFSSDAAHRAPDVLLSPDRLTVTRTSCIHWAWARSERGFPPACGAVKWAVKLSKESGGLVYRVGVVSDAFTGYTGGWPKKSWYFQNNGIYVDGEWQGNSGAFFSEGDVVTVELERRHGQDGVMRVRVAGKAFVRDMTALPRDGMLYPAVCLDNSKQSYCMVAAP
jgi:hypothetical protein